jgi:prepilin-type N-terminal cleavage/methylation domain-containing protein
MKRRGFTMAELLTAMTLLLITLTLVVAIFGAARKVFETAEEEYVMGSEASGAMRWLRHDLAFTSLSSVRVFPNRREGAGEPPGLSLISADRLGDFGELEISEHGTPRWLKYVYYSLTPDVNNPANSNLLRWEAPIAGQQNTPIPSDVMPARWPQNSAPRTVLRKLLSTGYGVSGGTSPTVVADRSQPGGFQVRFVRHGNAKVAGPAELVDENPTDLHGQSYGSDVVTELVEVSLYFADQSPRTGNWTTMKVSFRIYPQN